MIPNLRIVVATSAIAAACYLAFSIWVVLFSGDVALTGDVIGTWKSFAVAAFSFWLGSSSGGKASRPPVVTVDQPSDKPIPVEEVRP